MHDGVRTDIAEAGHFLAYAFIKLMLRPQDYDVGLYPHALQLLYGMLRGLRLQFLRGGQVGDVSKVHANGTAPQLPFQLPDGFEERKPFNVAYGASDFRYHEIEMVFPA